MTGDAKLYPTADKCIVVLLRAMKVPIVKTTKVGFRTTFYFDRGLSKEYLNNWQSGTPIPIPDIRAIFEAETEFNSIVHQEI